MENINWFTAPWEALGLVALTGFLNFVLLLFFTRLVGLRSFAKLSTFDFAITIAIGSLVGATVLGREPPLAQGATALAMLFALQYAVSSLRRAYPGFGRFVDNQPLLLMAHGEILTDNLAQARIARDELYSELRRAGIVHPDQVLAVVFESTGDVAVIPQSRRQPAPEIFRGVIDGERIYEGWDPSLAPDRARDVDPAHPQGGVESGQQRGDQRDGERGDQVAGE